MDNNDKNIEFSDSICTCRECDHKISRDCIKLHCNCCKKEDHSMVMNGFEGFETKNQELSNRKHY